MIWILFGVLALGIAWALVAKARRWEETEARFGPDPDREAPRLAAGGPSFGVVFVTVLKVIAAIVLIAVVAVVALLLIDQYVVSLTG